MANITDYTLQEKNALRGLASIVREHCDTDDKLSVPAMCYELSKKNFKNIYYGIAEEYTKVYEVILPYIDYVECSERGQAPESETPLASSTITCTTDLPDGTYYVNWSGTTQIDLEVRLSYRDHAYYDFSQTETYTLCYARNKDGKIECNVSEGVLSCWVGYIDSQGNVFNQVPWVGYYNGISGTIEIRYVDKSGDGQTYVTTKGTTIKFNTDKLDISKDDIRVFLDPAGKQEVVYHYLEYNETCDRSYIYLRTSGKYDSGFFFFNAHEKYLQMRIDFGGRVALGQIKYYDFINKGEKLILPKISKYNTNYVEDYLEISYYNKYYDTGFRVKAVSVSTGSTTYHTLYEKNPFEFYTEYESTYTVY